MSEGLLQHQTAFAVSFWNSCSEREKTTLSCREPSASVPVTAPTPVGAAPEANLADDTELVAVIAAAIAAYEGAISTDGFVVRSIRKINRSRH